MKKTFFVLTLITLIFALCCVSVYATNEDTTEVSNGAITEENTDTEASGEQNPGADAFYSGWIDKITDSTLWVNIGAVGVACLGIISTVVSKFKNIASLISNKADSNTVIDTVKTSVNDICDSFKMEINRIERELAASKNNEEKLVAMLTIFMTNAKINPNAKAEIMSYLTGIKKLDGNIEEIVAAANANIEASKKAEEKSETPALDLITAEAPTFMELG